MNKKTIGERLRVLALDDKNRSTVARLRDVIEDVETALAAGVTRSLVIEELAANGFQMTPSTFATTLKRIRKERKKSELTPPFSTSRPLNQSPEPDKISQQTEIESDPKSLVTNSHDPAELDKIFASKPDLAALAKLYKSTKRKQS